ncbi:hypothetical protein RDI58_022544 [Solanum bulbocastanum]
MKRSLS